MAKTTSEIDTRDKLEAEVQKWCGGRGYEYQVAMVYDWLDCQAIITERESLEEINVLRKYKTEIENQLETQRKKNEHLQELFWKTNEQLYNEKELTNNLREEISKCKSDYYKLRENICELVCDAWGDTV